MLYILGISCLHLLDSYDMPNFTGFYDRPRHLFCNEINLPRLVLSHCWDVQVDGFPVLEEELHFLPGGWSCLFKVEEFSACLEKSVAPVREDIFSDK